MSFLGRLFGKKEEAEELELGKFPGLEAPGLGQPPGIGSAPGGPGITEMPGERMPSGMPGGMPEEMPGRMPGMEEIGPGPPAPFPGMGAGMRGQPPSAFAPAPVQQVQSQPDIAREMQVVNAKLDTLKVLLDSINAKIDRIEQKPREEEAIPLSVRRWR